MSRSWQFTSEGVCMGHPDKMADQISDGVLDAIIKDDPEARVACETLVKTGMALVSGEITTKTYIEIPEVVRQTIKEIGYDSSEVGFDYHTCAVMTAITRSLMAPKYWSSSSCPFGDGAPNTVRPHATRSGRSA